jgi:hypothetical protein
VPIPVGGDGLPDLGKYWEQRGAAQATPPHQSPGDGTDAINGGRRFALSVSDDPRNNCCRHMTPLARIVTRRAGLGEPIEWVRATVMATELCRQAGPWLLPGLRTRASIRGRSRPSIGSPGNSGRTSHSPKGGAAGPPLRVLSEAAENPPAP